MKIKELPKVDMPREKLAKYGPDKLADHELLAIVLGSGTHGTNVLELAKRTLAKVREVGLRHAKLEHMQGLRGLGTAKAAQVVALIALARRLESAQNPHILSAEDIWKLCADIRNSKREHFVAFYLNSQNQLIERQIISIGTLTASLVHPREVFEPAIVLHAASVIVAHNHPSGKLEASEEDKEVTKRLRSAGSLLGIRLEDHVIVSDQKYIAIHMRESPE